MDEEVFMVLSFRARAIIFFNTNFSLLFSSTQFFGVILPYVFSRIVFPQISKSALTRNSEIYDWGCLLRIT